MMSSLSEKWWLRFREMKARGEKIAVLTAYDYPTARLLDEAGVDLILVGDSVGTVMLGYPDTTSVTMAEMQHHSRAVRRAVTHAPVIVDLPFGSYATPGEALANGRLLIAAGADAVKLEGGRSHFAQIQALTSAGLPVVAHIGMLPQSIREEGRYRVKGKTAEDAARLIDDARAVEEAGALAVVLELVQAETAAAISRAIAIPTIGIGAGIECDGQVLVTPDLIGLFPWFTPKHAKPKANVAAEIKRAVSEYIAETRSAT
jgi:3-methyl-2-oxobutanoate hydroxymethyltransferase